MFDDPYIIVSSLSGSAVYVWQGKYGWRPVTSDRPQSINTLNRYTLKNAERALARLQKNYGRMGANAQIIRHADAWTDDDTLNWTLLQACKKDES